MRLLLAFLLAVSAGGGASAAWTWRCESQRCVRHSAEDVTNGMSINKCKLTCGELSAVWPRPTGPASFGTDTVSFLSDNVQFTITAPDPVKPMLEEASEIFLESLQKLQPTLSGGRKPGCTAGGVCPKAVADQKVQVQLVVDGSETRLTLNTSEASRLSVNHTTGAAVDVLVYASTFFGARHGLETLSQLIEYDDEHASLQILDSASISDSPVYPFRAVMLDTARNFLSLAGLRRTIDAMSMNKLNTLHWHITDTHSFPIEVAREPRMAQHGAYSVGQVYSAAEVAELVLYAQQRGVRLLPELDAPAHVGYGWQWGEKAGLGRLAVCVGQEPWQSYCVEPPCGQMNIVNDNLYTVLESVYRDYDQLFQPDLFHMGGDEINLGCWKSAPEITEHIKQHGGDPTDDAEYMRLWSDFQQRAANLWSNVTGRDTPLLLWTSDLTKQEAVRPAVLPTSQYIIQVWTEANDSQIGALLEQGYPVILSNFDAWYLDCGFSAWVGAGHNWCAPYKSWQTVYDNSPRAIARSFQSARSRGAADYASLVLGGSAPLWSEQSDETTLDGRLWPRGAALAERLWAEPESDSAAALTRLVHHRERMVRRGVGAEALQPQYCHQNDGTCVL